MVFKNYNVSICVDMCAWLGTYICMGVCMREREHELMWGIYIPPSHIMYLYH